MLLCWYHNGSLVCRLSLPAVHGVLSVPSTQRYQALAKNWLSAVWDVGHHLLLARQGWLSCALASYCHLVLCPLLLDRDFSQTLLQKYWRFILCSCRMGHFLCWDRPVVFPLSICWIGEGSWTQRSHLFFSQHIFVHLKSLAGESKCESCWMAPKWHDALGLPDSLRFCHLANGSAVLLRCWDVMACSLHCELWEN